MKGRSLQADILERLNEAPERRCFCFYGPQEIVSWQSREQVYHRAVAAAQELKRQGLRLGDVYIIVLPSGETAVNTLLATLFLGAVPLLTAPPNLVGGNLELHKTLRGAVRRIKPRLVVCSSSIEPDLPHLKHWPQMFPRDGNHTRRHRPGSIGHSGKNIQREAAAPLLPETLWGLAA